MRWNKNALCPYSPTNSSCPDSADALCSRTLRHVNKENSANKNLQKKALPKGRRQAA